MRVPILTIGIVLFVLFLAFRVPGISLPYHQDECKNVSASETFERAGSFFAHPPLMQIMFVVAHKMFGADYFRIFPLLFALVSAAILFFVVRNRAGDRAAVWSVVLYATSFYSILGSLVPDVDGAILPFFFLLSVYAYDRSMLAEKFSIRWKWLSLLIGSLLVGFLIKLSFILVVGTILTDYVLNCGKKINKKEILTA